MSSGQSQSQSQSQSQAKSNSGASLSTKQVHPVTLSCFAPTGCELSTWAYLTNPRPADAADVDDGNQLNAYDQVLPNLVTAHGNHLKIFVVSPNGTLILAATYDNLAGNISTLEALPNASGTDSSSSSTSSGVSVNTANGTSTGGGTAGASFDGLLLGFAGQPRMSIVYPPGGLELQSNSNNNGNGNGNDNRNGSNGNDSSGNWSGVLTASSIIDLTPALIERSLGSVTPLEHNLVCSVTQDNKVPTVAVILGGGVSIAAFQLPRSNYGAGDNANTSTNKQAWWRTASEPYFLPLSKLSSSLNLSRSTTTSALYNTSSKYQHKQSSASQTLNQNIAKISHGFGDIISSAFLRGYTEPVLVLLHSNPHRYGGKACPGRLGHHSTSTRSPLSLTAISISIGQQRSVVIWSLPDVMPSDAFRCMPHPKGGVLVLGVNQVLYVNCAGKVQCCTSVNGWVRSTGSALLLSSVSSSSNHSHNQKQHHQQPQGGGIMQPNPSPLPKLGIQLDGCSLSFVNEHVAMLALRDGTLYSLELHESDHCVGVGGNEGVMCMSLSPVGKKLGGIGMISSLSSMPLLNLRVKVKVQTMKQKSGKLAGSANGSAKKEEAEEEMIDNAMGKWQEDEPSSLGLVFAGSRMGDSTLLLYTLKENVKLMPLEKDQELENSGQKLKRKRDEKDSDTSGNDNVNGSGDGAGIKKEKVEDDGNDNFNETTIDSGNDMNQVAANDDAAAVAVSDDETQLSEEEILQKEEAALYAWNVDDEGHGGNARANTNANAIPPFHGDENESSETLLPGITSKQLYRPQIRSMSIFQDTQVLDSLTGLGPIGPGCAGPTPGKETKVVSSLNTNVTRNPSKSSQTKIHACGYGSSGGLAVLNTPGLHTSSTILSEIDCLDIGAIFPCPEMGYFFVVKKGDNAGCIVMKIASDDNGEDDEQQALEEVEIDSIVEECADGESPIPSFQSVRDILTRMEILSVKEFKTTRSIDNSTKCVVMARYGSAYALVVLCMEQNKFGIEHSHFIGANDDGMLIDRENLVSVSFAEHLDRSRVLSVGEDLSLACVWSSGHSSVFTLSYQESWEVKELLFAKEVDNDAMDCDKDGKDDNGIDFYKSRRITAVDIFAIADSIFESTDDIVKHEDVNVKNLGEHKRNDILKFDEDDIELYGEEEIGNMTNAPKPSDGEKTIQGEETSTMAPSRFNTLGGYISGAGLSETSKVAVSIARQSGDIEIYDVAKLFSAFDGSMVRLLSDSEAKLAALAWSSSSGCGQGASVLNSSSASPRRPKSQESCTTEMRFFFSGPSNNIDSSAPKDLAILRSLCLLIETNKGDSHLYTSSKSRLSGAISFKRMSLNIVSRPSKDEAKHRNKLRRKGMTKECDETSFRSNRLHRFFSISGQDGLFAATSRPKWFLTERGAPSVLCHRLRHAAPSGGADVPIAGFCSGFTLEKGNSEKGFITVHDRIGRVGSQRLTLFNG